MVKTGSRELISAFPSNLSLKRTSVKVKIHLLGKGRGTKVMNYERLCSERGVVGKAHGVIEISFAQSFYLRRAGST